MDINLYIVIYFDLNSMFFFGLIKLIKLIFCESNFFVFFIFLLKKMGK